MASLLIISPFFSLINSVEHQARSSERRKVGAETTESHASQDARVSRPSSARSLFFERAEQCARGTRDGFALNDKQHRARRNGSIKQARNGPMKERESLCRFFFRRLSFLRITVSRVPLLLSRFRSQTYPVLPPSLSLSTLPPAAACPRCFCSCAIVPRATFGGTMSSGDYQRAYCTPAP